MDMPKNPAATPARRSLIVERHRLWLEQQREVERVPSWSDAVLDDDSLDEIEGVAA